MRDGGDALTIAAVAGEAGVSKGGLFYHFASKELLVEGLVTRYVAEFDELIATAGEEPGAAARAYLRSAEESAPASQPVVALLAAAVVSPSALDALRERYRRWQLRLDDDGIPADVASTVRFAVDGLWLADTLELAPVLTFSRADAANHRFRTANRARGRILRLALSHGMVPPNPAGLPTETASRT